MWTWDQSKGALYADGGTSPFSTGYSGAGRGKNNPSMQAAVAVGPIPAGDWLMTGMVDSPNTGPHTIILAPLPDTDTCGRSAFRIHGDSISDPGNASHGCIILPRAARDAVWASKDRQLRVIA